MHDSRKSNGLGRGRLPFFGDFDKDGVLNLFDCDPRDPRRDGFFGRAAYIITGGRHGQSREDYHKELMMKEMRRQAALDRKRKLQMQKIASLEIQVKHQRLLQQKQMLLMAQRQMGGSPRRSAVQEFLMNVGFLPPGGQQRVLPGPRPGYHLEVKPPTPPKGFRWVKDPRDMTYKELRKAGFILPPNVDTDRDRVINKKDCKPLDPTRQHMVWNPSIGMFHISRPRCESCVHASPMCAISCYSKAREQQYKKHMRASDIKSEHDWKTWGTEEWQKDIMERAFTKEGKPKTLKGQELQTERIRLMERGEAFRDPSDIPRVKAILEAFPESEIWIPTRAWHDPKMRKLIEKEIMPFKNVRVHASMDPTDVDKPKDIEAIKGKWSTMYFGIDEAKKNPMGEQMTQCPKTWEKVDPGFCATCPEGCFQPGVHHIHLKGHGAAFHKESTQEFIDKYRQKAMEEHPEWFED